MTSGASTHCTMSENHIKTPCLRPHSSAAGKGKLVDVVSLHTTIRLLYVRIALEVELVNEATSPDLVVIALVHGDEGLEPSLAGLHGHEPIHRHVQGTCRGEQLLRTGPRDYVGHRRPNVLG